MKKRPKIEMPSEEEDREINAGIAADANTSEATAEEFQQMRGPGRPAGSAKTSTTLRLDDDVLEAFRAGGKGWQTRINDALREWLEQHR